MTFKNISIGAGIGTGVVVLFAGLCHLVSWLMTKGVIWVAKELFNVNWYEKFWVVYVCWIIVGVLLKSNVFIRR